MNKKFVAVLFFLPFAALVVWVSSLCVTVFESREAVVAISGYDPRDLLSGRYISYTINWDKTDCSQFEDNICPKDKFCKDGNCRYYVPEQSAYLIDEGLRYAEKRGLKFEVVYSYHKNRVPIAERLLINGEDWRVYAEKYVSEEVFRQNIK